MEIVAIISCIICKNGIEFSSLTNIALAEQFVRIDVLLPFPKLSTEISSELVELAARIAELRTHDPINCPFFTNMKGNIDLSTHTWMYHHVDSEHDQLKIDLKEMIDNVTRMFPVTKADKTHRQKRTVAIAAVVVAASATVGAMIGSTLSCGTANPFTECTEMSNENIDTVNDLITTVNNVSDSVIKIQNADDYKMFLVTEQLIEMQTLQNNILKIQGTNWANLRKQLEIIVNNTHVLNDCQQSLFTQQQLAYNGFLISDALSAVLVNVRSLRLLVKEFQNTILQSLTAVRARLIPFTIIPQRVLMPILLDIEHQLEGTRPFRVLSITTQEILAYYETQIVTKVQTQATGITFSLAIPVSSPDTMMTVYKAQVIPMPQEDTDTAVVWNVESEYIAVSENMQNYALLSQSQIDMCLGTTTMRICYNPFATHTTQTQNVGACIVTLFMQDENDIVNACTIQPYPLPNTVQARGLGNNRWLITAQNSRYDMKEYKNGMITPANEIRHPGCRVCIIEIPCNHVFDGPNIRMRAQEPFCNLGQSVIQISTITTGLTDLFNLIQTIDAMPQFQTVVQARTELLRQVQIKIIDMPKEHRIDRARLVQIATPVAINMKRAQPMAQTSVISHTKTWLYIGLALLVWLVLICLGWEMAKCVYKLGWYVRSRNNNGIPIAMDATNHDHQSQSAHIYEAAT